MKHIIDYTQHCNELERIMIDKETFDVCKFEDGCGYKLTFLNENYCMREGRYKNIARVNSLIDVEHKKERAKQSISHKWIDDDYITEFSNSIEKENKK